MFVDLSIACLVVIVALHSAIAFMVARLRRRADERRSARPARSHQIQAVRKRLDQRTVSGLVLFSGTTGSGKSTTMSNRLSTLCRERLAKVVLTVEDPVEYVIPPTDGGFHRGANRA